MKVSSVYFSRSVARLKSSAALVIPRSPFPDSNAKIFFKEVVRSLLETGLDRHSGLFLVQWLSIAIQRGNAVNGTGLDTFASGMMRGSFFEFFLFCDIINYF